MAPTDFDSRDATLFLAMCWSGGGPFDLSDLHFVYDWINRGVLSASEMEGALNRLLAATLIEETSGKFAVPRKIYDEFETFRKRRRQGRFKDAAAFLKQYQPLQNVPKRVRISEERCQQAYDEYDRRFREADSIHKATKTQKRPTRKK